MTEQTRLAALSEAGVSIWLDDLSTNDSTRNNLAELIRDSTWSG